MFRKRKLNKGIIFAAAICIILAAAALFAIAAEKRSWEHFKQTAIETTATITNIHKEHKRVRSNGKTRRKTVYTVTVEYEANGEKYETTLNYHTSLMRVGDPVTIYYDPNAPANSMTDPKYTNMVFTVLGGIFLFVGVLLSGKELKDYIRINSVINSGKYVLCDDWTEGDAPLTVNGTRYHWITCRYIDDRGGEHTFTSSTFHPNRAPFLPGNPVKVYVDLDNSEKVYFVSDEGH